MIHSMDFAAMLALAIGHHRAGRLAEAERLYAQIVQREPANADALHLLGVVACQSGRYDPAFTLISKALSLNPLAPEYHNSLAVVRQARGEEMEAIRLYLHAIHLKDDYLEPYYNIIRLHPASAEVRFNLGCVLQRQGRIQEAIEQYTKVLECAPHHAKAFNNRGGAFRELDRLDEAVADFREAVRIEPDCAEAYNNLGQTLHDQGLLKEAIDACHTALSLCPDFADAYYNIGRSLHEQGRYEEAIEQFRHVIQIAPCFADAYYNWGVALSGLGCYKEAIDKYKEALRIDFNSVKAHANLGLLLLLTEDYQKGWGEYDWRMQRPDWRKVNPVYPDVPRWDGSATRDRTILVQAEQGFGDIIQFVRYLPLVATRCRKVILEAPPILHSLLECIPDISELVEANPENARKADVAVHLLSLPGLFDTRIDSIPSVFPYLSVPVQRLEKWQEKIQSHGFRVGITWSGNPANSENRERSCNLNCFARLAAIPGVTLFSLQKGEASEQLRSQAHGMNIVDLGPLLDDFSDTAAAIMHLDLVVSVDTALVHLAGALGRPVWTLRYHSPYWVWGLTGPSTPWYPSMRIFRQQHPEDWDAVFDEVAEVLAQHLGAVVANKYPCELGESICRTRK